MAIAVVKLHTLDSEGDNALMVTMGLKRCDRTHVLSSSSDQRHKTRRGPHEAAHLESIRTRCGQSHHVLKY